MAGTLWMISLSLALSAVVSSQTGPRDKRSDDRPALEAVVSGLSQQVSLQAAQLTALQNTVLQLHDKASLHVAFHARLSKHVELNLNQVVPFDLVFSNLGAAYDPSLGLFSAPVSGVYVFMFSSRASTSTASASLRLDVNGSGHIFLDDVGTGSTATSHGVVHLQQGGKVLVRSNSPHVSLYSYTTLFTGFLLNPDQ